ncbi:phytase [Deinococcus maricopensis]|uniref:3-phytase n=1 Tax=Deinococcus maricopensis (strain DSM 21211 / LMG 22137 / NRRL B-23946 / LB-34) TaxID=709986 RepID=E8U4Z1_DEIML|nr:phytase [Deinococcus maricopensis]ADV66130.1 3-phytase [Deinococcus maricopensis DSM 21211]
MTRFVWWSVGLSLLLGACAPRAAVPSGPVNVAARAESAGVTAPADSDDPAVWVDPQDASRSLVIGTRKDAGLTVFDLQGRTLQDVAPTGVRYNNVDVVYGFNLGGRAVDLAVASDRKNDRLAVYAIDPVTRTLTDVSSATMPMVFTPAGAASDGANTAYGLAAYRTADGSARVFVSQRKHARVAEVRLVADGDRVTFAPVRTVDLPASSAENPQVEGMVVDAELGFAYLGQEQVGIWKLPLAAGTPRLMHAVKPAGAHLAADVEGLTIYRSAGGRGYLLASSQGDNTFAVFDRTGDNAFLGSFRVTGGAVDGSEACDGAVVVNANFGAAFPRGLLVVQDGENDGVKDATNFKLVAWEDVAAPLGLRAATDAPGVRE